MKRKRLGMLLLALVIAFSVFSAAALADDSGTISLEAVKDGVALTGMSFKLYKVADVDDAGKVTATTQAADALNPKTMPQTVSDSQEWRDVLNALGGAAAQLNPPLTTGNVDSTGKLTFSGTYGRGIYLIVGEEFTLGDKIYTPGTAWALLPSPSQGMNVTVETKHGVRDAGDPVNPVTVQVVVKWEDAGLEAYRPTEVTVQLLKNGVVDQTATLTMPEWSHTWPGLDGSARWEVREIVPNGYTATYDINGNVTTITNARSFVEVDPPIHKLVTGDPGAPLSTSTFRFRMEAVSNTVGLSKAEMPMPAGASGGVKIVTVTGPDSNQIESEFGVFRLYLPGTYVYMISEEDVGETGYTYDENFYYKVFKVEEVNNRLSVSEYLQDSRQQAQQDIDPTFINRWKPDPTDSVSVTLSAIKKLTGATPPTTADFEMNLVGKNGAPMPTGSTGSRKSIKIHGAGSGSFGAITFTSTGTYVYEVSERNGRLEGYTYDTTLYTVTVTVTRKSDGKLAAAVSAVNNHGQSVQWDNLVFTNNYKEPSPHTGILWWPVPLLLAGGLLLTFAGLVRRRHES